MTSKIKNKIKALQIISVLICVIAIFTLSRTVQAASPTDEILDYTITVDINDDATANIIYEINWLVLDSDELGPLEWVNVGIPNRQYQFTESLSDNIDYISINTDGGVYAEVHFKDAYYEGESVDFKFMLVTDNLYLMNNETGKTTYSFTPGWFDGIEVDNLTINWNYDKVDSWSPAANIEEGYIKWNTSLSEGERCTVDVVYPNDAYAFTVYESEEDNWENMSLLGKIATIFGMGIGFIIIMGVSFSPVLIIAAISYLAFKGGSGFGSDYDKKVTRTRIEYYPECQGCGASREESKDKCAYCGRDMVKSKTVIDETKVANEDKEALKYKKDGTYHYSSLPNTYVMVNTVRVPRPRTSSRSSGSSHHSSCAHSSCACACACACAGGGRAGCTMKDFYKTNLKLKYLRK